MTRTRLTLLLLIGINLLLNSGCEKVVEESELNFRNDKFYPVNSDTPYTGRIVSYYESGQLEESASYKEGILDGLSKSYFENGQLQFIKKYISGEFIETMIRYDRSGTEVLMGSGYYDTDKECWIVSDDSELIYRIGGKIIRNGELGTADGEVVEFLRKSNEELCNVPVVNYYDSGNLYTKYYVNNGKLSYYEGYYEDGAVMSKQNYVNGLPHGLLEFFHEDGTLWIKYNYVDGVKQGIEEYFNDDGMLYRRSNFVDGVKQGIEEYFNDDGTVESTANYVDGEKVNEN